MIQFYKETYPQIFNFDDLNKVQFSHYYTDNGYENGYYDINISLLPIEVGKKYIFSYYRFLPPAIGTQESRTYRLLHSFGPNECVEPLASLGEDKYGNNYPANVSRLYWYFEATSSTNMIKIRMINRNYTNLINCKTENGEEPFLNPQGYSKSFYAYGFQLEQVEEGVYTPSDYSLTTEDSSPGVSPNKLQSFQYFIYKLYGLKGLFYDEPVKYFKENDTILKEKRRLDCGSTPCFETKFDSLPNYLGKDKFNIYKYKGIDYLNSPIYNFFITEIEPYLSNVQDLNFPKLYTDFEKLYFVGQMYNSDGSKNGNPVLKTYEKNQGDAIVEIINLLEKYKNFDSENFIGNRKVYSLPISFPGVSHSPIEEEDLDNILFTGYLNRPVDLNIQAGFCRYYLNPEDPKPKISGYFYETSEFFDVKNTDLINEFNQFEYIFPSRTNSINKRPSFYISDIRKLNFSRLLKNDSSVNFVKILNYTGYVNECYFKELKTGVSVQLTGNYITNRRMSDVWQIQIKNDIDSVINDAELGTTDIGINKWTFQDFGPIKNSSTNSKYLKIIHKNIQLGSFIPLDTANVKLITTANAKTYIYSDKVL
jgi:hypothetical protein